jgi:hypothetical protein
MAKHKVSENSLKNLEMANPANNFNNSEVARNAQKKSVESRKKNQTLAELLRIALTLQNEETGETNNIAITNAIINKAAKGDVSAYQTIRDTIGEKPVDKQEIKTNQPAVLSEYSEKKIEEVLQRIKKTTYE